MTPFENQSKIPVKLPKDHPELLTGLDTLVTLGLISHNQVKQLCSQYLICTVILTPKTEYQEIIPAYQPVKKHLIATLPSQPKLPTKPNFISAVLQSLAEELSVRWLLFLGVFLVVLSSGVLAASQWQKFPAIAQYGVLLTYTLSFWGLTSWGTKQNNLRLTAQTLLMVTLLLIPINFWAIDSFSLWQNKLNWVIIGSASLILSFINKKICQNRTLIPNFPQGKLPIINIISLSYLHWGWHLTIFPLIATYLAMIGTTFLTIYHQLDRTENNQETTSNTTGIYFYFGFLTYGLLLILSRAIFIAKVNITQLGLAIGICGSLVIWLGQKNLKPTNSLFWENCGLGIIFVGWMISLPSQPLPAILMSILSLFFLYIRLDRHNLEIDLIGIFLIGLQTIWFTPRLIPEIGQKFIITTASDWTNSQNHPWALLSITLFPQILFMLCISNNLYKKNQRKLANLGEKITAILGICLTFIGLINPAIRTVNLLCSTITLFNFTQRRNRDLSHLIYINHSLMLLTLFSAINWFLPNLQLPMWATILLAVMVLEFAFSTGNGTWKRSGWYLGLALAGISFVLLWVHDQNNYYYWYSNFHGQKYDQISHYWRGIWLITPVSLTVLASCHHQPQQTRLLSILSVVIAQLLTLPLPGVRLISLGVGLVILFFNNRYFVNVLYAGITVGFSLTLLTGILWNGVFGLVKLTLWGWFTFGSLIILSLWLCRNLLLRKNTELSITYATASNQWAIALCSLQLIGITLHSSAVYFQLINTEFFYSIPTAITLIAIIYRIWQQPTNLAFYSIGWCLEILTFQILAIGEYSHTKIIIANITLGLTTQLFGEWWKHRYQVQTLPNSFHILPIFYGLFSIILRLNTFADWTGFTTLGVALILIGVGRRQETLKTLVYLGVIGISISAYELLFYQMSQAKGGYLGDGLIAMATLGTTIMYGYRSLTFWLINYLRLNQQTLKKIAHIHWLWSSFLFMLAITLPVNINLYLGLGTGLFLSRYAIWQGKSNAQKYNNNNENWVYIGLIEFGFLALYLYKLPTVQLIVQQLLPWWAAISCLLAYFFYRLPWENLGWSKTPWQRTSYILPLIILCFTAIPASPITLIITAAYYIFMAKIASEIRFTYISLILIDWALFRFLQQFNIQESLWYITIIALSILYIAQIDPELQIPESKTLRHNVRMLATGLIGGWTILVYQHLPFIPGIFSIVAIFAGLGLKIRSFLYVGTGVFLITSIYQLVIFSYSYAFLKWIIGLLVGIMLIYIAANFETRRTQIISILRNISDEFENWQ